MHGGDDESPDKIDEKSSEDKTEKTEKTEKEVLTQHGDQWNPLFLVIYGDFRWFNMTELRKIGIQWGLASDNSRLDYDMPL